MKLLRPAQGSAPTLAGIHPHMPSSNLQFSAFDLGFLTGARSFASLAVLCWGSRLGWFSFTGTPFAVMDRPAALTVASLLAAGELIGDKLPNTPARTAAVPLFGRVALGATAGVALAFASDRAQPAKGDPVSKLAPALCFGALGALLGTFGTFYARRGLTKQAGLPDLPVALLEDSAVLAGAFTIASHFKSPEEAAHG